MIADLATATDAMYTYKHVIDDAIQQTREASRRRAGKGALPNFCGRFGAGGKDQAGR